MAGKAKSNKTSKKKICNNCKKELALTNFYSSSSPMFDGKTPLCKKCIKELINFNDMKTIYSVLQTMDIPFLYDVWETAKEKKGDIFGNYMRMMNSLPQYSSLRWGNSAFKEDIKQKKLELEIENDLDDFTITKEIIKRWGRGYSVEDYEFLEDTYSEWCTKYNSDTLSEQKTFQFLSLKELEIRKARESGGNVDKLEETFRKFMSDANVVPRDAKAMNDSENLNTLGIWTMDIEKYRPAEYFKDKKVYYDHDGLRGYYERFILRPLKNLLAGTREFDSEFNVENEVNNTSDSEEVGDENGES